MDELKRPALRVSGSKLGVWTDFEDTKKLSRRIVSVCQVLVCVDKVVQGKSAGWGVLRLCEKAGGADGTARRDGGALAQRIWAKLLFGRGNLW